MRVCVCVGGGEKEGAELQLLRLLKCVRVHMCIGMVCVCVCVCVNVSVRLCAYASSCPCVRDCAEYWVSKCALSTYV